MNKLYFECREMEKIRTILCLLLMISCNNKSFEWTPELKEITGGDLYEWLQKSPFQGEWKPKETEGKKIIIDNRKQIFPFIHELNNEEGRWPDYERLYKASTILYEDPQLGICVVSAYLQYEAEELFKVQNYSNNGLLGDKSEAVLSETLVYGKNESYKAVIYWAETTNTPSGSYFTQGYAQYLVGFYQKGKLVVEFAFPCMKDDKKTGIKKIKEINTALKLGVKEWENIRNEQLEISQTPHSFWTDPYHYISLYDLGVSVRTRDFKFQVRNDRYSNRYSYDYYLFHKGNNIDYGIEFKQEYTPLTAEQHRESLKEKKADYPKDLGDFSITDKRVVQNVLVEVAAECYFKDNYILKVKMSYPHDEASAEKQMFKILKDIYVY